MDRLWEVAPPTTWALLTLASVCLMAGFVLLSHTIVRRKAYRDGWSGWTAPGRLEGTVRGGTASLLAGALVWAITLDAPALVIILAGAGAAVAAGLQAVAWARRRRS